jgi:hypothetical protein
VLAVSPPPSTDPEMWYYVAQIVDMLGYMHGKGVIFLVYLLDAVVYKFLGLCTLPVPPSVTRDVKVSQ